MNCSRCTKTGMTMDEARTHHFEHLVHGDMANDVYDESDMINEESIDDEYEV